MTRPVLLAHADDDEHLAKELARPLERAGYQVVYRGSMLVGESLHAEASKALSAGAPVVLCGTITAMGTPWAHTVVNAARQHASARIFAVQMDKLAYLAPLALDAMVAHYWQDPQKAVDDLLAALERYYPVAHAPAESRAGSWRDAERRYRELALSNFDIVDLANLPQSDRHLAIKRLELRRLYVALRVTVEIEAKRHLSQDELARLEQRWDASRSGWFLAKSDRPATNRHPVPLGERLSKVRRLVVLGDPGAGKTTMLRWIATAYLLRLKDDPDWRELPDIETLPDADWLPILIRCRDLDPNRLGDALDDLLYTMLRKAQLSGEDSLLLRTALVDKLRSGQALLLIDGLDEITDSGARARFCRHIESIHVAYPDAPVIVTSRLVGYREMGYRIGRGFEHVIVGDLSKQDKDKFAQRWCTVTEPPSQADAAASELIRDIHSMDRIERLTSNPMLLTTMALVKRQVGKLPSRRASLYAQAVQVLLNWRSEVDEPLDPFEALPQLQYIAAAMCDRGVQRLREDELVDLVANMRREHPQVHPAHAHTPRAFVQLLEARTGMIVKVGQIRHDGWERAVLEFRHLTFQEYLAGLALVEGRISGIDRPRQIAARVAPLAGRISEVDGDSAVVDNWREAIRLCVTSCNDEFVDEVLIAILTPRADDSVELSIRPRAVLAAPVPC